MATTIDTRENIQQGPADSNAGLDVHEQLSGGDNLDKEPGEPEGYIVYLTERELFEAYPRAKRENPGALVHFERHDDDLWSLEVYKSEIAKHVFLENYFERLELVSSLTHLGWTNGVAMCGADFGAGAPPVSAKARANASGRIGPP